MDDVAAFALASLCDDTRGISVEQRLLARLRHRVIVQNQNGELSYEPGRYRVA